MANKPCYYIQITTPKNYILDGLWFGGEKPKTGIIFVHSLASSAFSHHDYLVSLIGKNTAAIFFSNRGHDKVTGIRKIDRKSEKGYKHITAGEAHEIFSECVDDIQGAVDYFLNKKVENIFLVGHSTGCQKIVYYLAQKGRQKKIIGVVLLCPISDYASIKKSTDPNKLKRAQQLAKKFVDRGEPQRFLPSDIWPNLLDAQRFLSLYTPDSKEEIFTYAQLGKIPRVFQKVKIPLLTIFAENDEYRDRDIDQIAGWFENNIKSKQSKILVIPGALHSFNGKEHLVSKEIKKWLRQMEF